MYAFTKTNEEALNTSSHTEMEFNGAIFDRELTDVNGGFRTLLVEGRAISSYSVETVNASGSHGGILGSRFLNPRIITVTYKLWDATNEGFRRRYEKLNMLLIESEKKLRFTDDAYHYFIASFSDGDSPEEDSNEVISTLTFICHDPVKYTEPLAQKNVVKVQVNALLPSSPVVEVMLNNGVNEFKLTNTTTGKIIHMKSTVSFSPSTAVRIDTRNWSISQNGIDRMRDLVITSDLEDFKVKRDDVLALSVPGYVNITVEGVAL